MDRTSIPSPSSPPCCRHRRHQSRAWAAIFLVGSAAAGLVASPTLARGGDVSTVGLIDQGQADARLKGLAIPAGFKLELVADAALLSDPVAMTFDDSGRVLVAESAPAARLFDVWESVTLEDGSKARLQRRRKPTTDTIKRLSDRDGDGRFDQAEVVVEGIERPTALLWIKGSIYAAALGRLDRWDDTDGDGRFETRTTLIDGFGALDERGLTGLTLGNDGFLYLTAGDNPTHAYTPAGGSRVDLARTGGLFRCRPDGSELQVVASGFRSPRGGVAFDADMRPILIDDDGSDGSRLAGVRLIQPTDQSDYGWRSLGDALGSPDHDLGAVDGDRPGRLAGLARLNHAPPSSFVVYNGTNLPAVCRGLVIATDPERHAVIGIKLKQAEGVTTLGGEAILIAADGDGFRPEQVTLGADSALYLLDRGERPGPGTTGGDSPTRAGGRIYRLAGIGPATPYQKWEQVTALTDEQLLMQVLPSQDYAAADRALWELVDRGEKSRASFLNFAGNATQPLHARLMGIQGARQFWTDEVEMGMANLQADAMPEVRRLAAEALSVEPKRAVAPIVSRLLDRLVDPDPRVVRALALAIGRHGETNPRQPGAALVRWLYSHPQADAATRDGILRGIERLGDVGVDEVALAVRTRRGLERETAVQFYAALRSAHAAEELTGLIKIPDLSAAERATLIRQFADFSPELAVSTTGLVDWVVKHPEVDPIVKRAALATCRYVGNPASTLIQASLDADDESVRIAAAGFAARTRPPGAMTRLSEVVGDVNRSSAERLVAAECLGWAASARFPALEAAFLGADDIDLRRATLRSMAAVDPPRAIPALVSALNGPAPALRLEAIELLGTTPAGAQAAGRAYLDGTLTRDDLPAVLRGLQRHETIKEVRATLNAVKVDATRGKTALSASALKLRAVESGNPWSGLEVFERATTRCASCHQVGGKGGRSGPSLDTDAHGLTAEKLIDAIMHPSREIKPGYEPARLALADPRAADPSTGSRVGKLPAPLVGLDRSQITTDPAKHPAMPEGLDLDLTPQELADLVAFLLDPPAQAAVRQGGIVALDRWLVAGPFAPGADSLRITLDRVDPSKTLAGEGGRNLSWLPLAAADSTATTPDQINLGGLVGVDLGQAYAATEIRSPATQAGWLYAATRGATRVYLNGAKVVATSDQSSGREEASKRDFVRLNLKAGNNLILVAFDHPARGEPRATFRIGAGKPVEVRVPKGPEGSPR